MTNPVEGYQILEQPYSGTNTIVYRAVREADHLPVILKVVAGDCPTADQLGRYRHEFEIINIIKSNNIIGVVDLAQNQSLCSLVLEDCGGQSLAQLKKDGYDFNIPEFLSVAIKIVEIPPWAPPVGCS